MNESFAWNPWNMETILIAILIWHVECLSLQLGMVYMWSAYLCSYPLKFFPPERLGITPDSLEQMSFSDVSMQTLGVDSQDPSLFTPSCS